MFILGQGRLAEEALTDPRKSGLGRGGSAGEELLA